jgi:phosphohistidine swiveling domain-containing protein
MKRRRFLECGATAASVALPSLSLGAQSFFIQPDPPEVGPAKLVVAHESTKGRVLVGDSGSYVGKSATENDVVVSGSFAGAAAISYALALRPVKGLISHDAGVGKDRAGISGLDFADQFGVPVAAVSGESATLANGNSVMAGVISYVNKAATVVGLKAGMPTSEAAVLMLNAAPGRQLKAAAEVDNTMRELSRTQKGRILAVWALVFLPDLHPNDVFCLATHSAQVAAEHAFRWNVKGWIANDAGPGKNHSGISGLAICGKRGMPAASVSAMSARIGDAMSTYDTGVISFVNEPARAKGVDVGMTAREALRLIAI